jgi:hypothetical protein
MTKLVIPPIETHEKGLGDAPLDRTEFGGTLLNLITRIDEPLVIGLDAPWGEGKTTFIKLWRTMLKREGIESIYLDAFEQDYQDEPFISILSAFLIFSETHYDENQPALKNITDFKEKAIKVATVLLPIATKITAKAITLNVLKDSDIDQIKEAQQEIASETSNLIGSIVEEKLDDYKQASKTIESFRDQLAGLASDINENTGKPLVFIIDELDRCRPSYALELLERIKHLLSVPNTVFMLAINRDQLEQSIRACYGNEIDAGSYLQKFVHLYCQLPKVHVENGQSDYRSYCEHLYAAHELETWGDMDAILRDISQLAIFFQLTLRQLERVFTLVTVFYSAITDRSFRQPGPVCYLAILRVKDPSTFRELSTGRINYFDLVKTDLLPPWEHRDDEGMSDIDWLHAELCCFSVPRQVVEDSELSDPKKARIGDINRSVPVQLKRIQHEFLRRWCGVLDLSVS